ncbi:unnamed protein product [Rotaria socialis]
MTILQSYEKKVRMTHVYKRLFILWEIGQQENRFRFQTITERCTNSFHFYIKENDYYSEEYLEFIEQTHDLLFNAVQHARKYFI